MKTNWQRLQIPDNIRYFIGKKAVKICIPDSDYYFLHPLKLFDYGQIIVGEVWEFKCYKSEKQPDGTYKILDMQIKTLPEMEQLLLAVPLLHIPPKLNPVADLQPLEELLDD